VITSAGVVLAGTFAALGTLPLVFITEIGFAVAFGVLRTPSWSARSWSPRSTWTSAAGSGGPAASTTNTTTTSNQPQQEAAKASR
jgi:uncharacterized membrane protein YdfJ with MMPL/SSD domain